MAIELRPSNITLPNITVKAKYRDDILISHVLTANEGFVIYDTAANDVEPKTDPETGDLIVDPETGAVIEIPVIYYCREVTIPINVPVENWTWVAVLESTVDENYIFGGGNDHETA